MSRHLVTSLMAGACLLLLGVGQAQARDLRQDAFEAVRVAMTPAPNFSSVRQDGSSNGAAIAQSGVGNSASIRQFGNGHTGAITQTGDYNTACLIQVGRGLDGAITQVGDNNSVGIIQTRQGTREIPPELCMIDNDSRGFWMSTARRAARRLSR